MSLLKHECAQNLVTNKKAEQYYRVKYELQQRLFLKSSKLELHEIHKKYPSVYVERDVSAQDETWESVIHLQKVIMGDGDPWSEYRRDKFLRDLRDNFFQIATKSFISRPNFESCFFKVSPGYTHRTTKDRTLVTALDAVYRSFDVLSKGTFDWRQFLFFFYFVSNPKKPVGEQLQSAFSKIGNKSIIDLQELGVVLFPLVRANVAEHVLHTMDEAWAQVKASQQEIDDTRAESIRSTRLTLAIFRKMIELQNRQTTLFEQSKSPWGRGTSFPVFIYQWEEEFYNDVPLQLVKVSRREASIEAKLKRDDSRTKLYVWKHWLDFTSHQCSLRLLLSRMNHRVELRRKSRGLLAFSLWTFKHYAALNIQRVGRGLLGRRAAKRCWIIFSSCTMIQTHFRMHQAKKRLNFLAARYTFAIVQVQRIIRGALGRRLAFRKLMTLVEQAHLDNVKYRESLEFERGVWCLTKLQAAWRRKKATLRLFELRQKRQREMNITRAMDADRKLFLRERQIYQKQLEIFYRSMREEQENNKVTQSRIAQDQIKVRTLRRRLKNEERLSAPPDNSDLLATEKWKSDWEVKIASNVKNAKSFCIHCLEQPENAVEKQKRAQIRKRVKGRVPQVLARAKDRGIPMETPEAKRIAREEVLHIIGEEERERLCSAMNKDCVERERLKEKARLEIVAKKTEAHARASIYAISIVAMACRKWLARKELRRLCLKTYSKKFDETNHAFFYRNNITGDVSWIKPKAMSTFDIPAKDEWKLLRDFHNFPYYFNTRSLVALLPPVFPPDINMCCGVVPHNWWREYPVRFGRCPEISRLQELDGKWYCKGCFPCS